MPSERLDRLRQAVRDLDRILILTHNDPDPDAIASALALNRLLGEISGIQCPLLYEGIIGRAENKALVRYLEYPLRHINVSDLQAQDAVALVDTQPGAGNNVLPPNYVPFIVIDHHAWQERTAHATFYDVRSDAGATSTILTEYFREANVEPDPPLATALFYGIKTDTRGLARGDGPLDAGAYFFLQSRIDVEALSEIENAQIPADYFRAFDTALHTARIYDGILTAYIGQMGYPDQAAEIADFFLRLEGARWVICMGAYEDELLVSIRTRSPRGGAGNLARDIMSDLGTAGGHGEMAGGQINLAGEEPEPTAVQLRQRILEYFNVPPELPAVQII